MKTSESIANISSALVKFQAECPTPKKVAENPHFKSKYSPLDEILNVIKPVMAKHGLSQIQSTLTEGDMIGVKTILLHESGEFLEFDCLWLPMGKATAQGAGSSITYARRYAISAALGLASETDDDGNAASEPQPPKQQQTQSYNAKADDKRIKVIFAKIATLGKVPGKTVDGVKKKLAETMGVPSLDNFTSQQITQAIDILSGWEKAVLEKAGA